MLTIWNILLLSSKLSEPYGFSNMIGYWPKMKFQCFEIDPKLSQIVSYRTHVIIFKPLEDALLIQIMFMNICSVVVAKSINGGTTVKLRSVSWHFSSIRLIYTVTSSWWGYGKLKTFHWVYAVLPRTPSTTLNICEIHEISSLLLM